MPPMKPTLPTLNTLDPANVGLLVAHPVSDGSGATLMDLSGNGHPAAIQSLGVGSTWFSDPVLGTVLQLDGANGFAILDSAIAAILSAQTTGSVAFWLKLRNATPGVATKTGLCRLQGMTGAGSITRYPFTDGKGYFSIFRQTTRADNAAAGAPLGAADRTQWHHLCITTISNGLYRVYVNGVQVHSEAAEFNVSVTAPCWLGKSTDDATLTGFLDGWLGDFRVWTRVLLPTEVLSLFNNPWSLYTSSAQQAQDKILQYQLEVNDESFVNMRELSPQVEASPGPSSELRTCVIMADLVLNPAPPYSIADGLDPRYKPIAPTLFPDTITSGLTLAIPFYEGSGVLAHDKSGSAADGTVAGGATWQADATSGFLKPTQAKAPDVAFPSNTSRVTVPFGLPVQPPGDQMTLACWFVAGASTGTNMVLMSKINDPNDAVPNSGSKWSYLLFLDASMVPKFHIADDIDSSPANEVASSTAVVAGQLYHLVATYNGLLMRLYLNGVLVGTRADAGNIPYNSNGNHNLYIGSDESGGGQWRFPGRIEDVRIWNRPITAQEVLQLYGPGTPTLPGGLGAFGIYCNAALARPLFTAQLEVQPEDNVATRMLQEQVEADALATTVQVTCIAMADVALPARNGNFAVLSVSPVLGPTSGGTLLSIKGYNLATVTSVLVGGVPLTGLTIISNSEVRGTTGAHVAGLVDVLVITSNIGQVTAFGAFGYVSGFTPQALLGIVGAQLDSSLIQTSTFNNETAPLGGDTVLSFTLPDVPVSPACVDVTVRRIGQPGGVWMRQGPIYDYTVDMVNKKIVWKGATAAFALVSGDEITIRALYQGN
jgi:hypothetical protein